MHKYLRRSITNHAVFNLHHAIVLLKQMKKVVALQNLNLGAAQWESQIAIFRVQTTRLSKHQTLCLSPDTKIRHNSSPPVSNR